MMSNNNEDVNRPKEKIMDDGKITTPHFPGMVLERRARFMYF
jgi:hypothetical protein